MNPPAQRRAVPGVFQEPQRTQPIAKRRIFRVGSDFGDRIHIERGSRIGGGLVGNEEARYGPAPPTNTSSPSSGRRRRAAMINRSRFESFIGFSEPAAQLRLCNLSFTNAAVPQGVGKGQVLVER